MARSTLLSILAIVGACVASCGGAHTAASERGHSRPALAADGDGPHDSPGTYERDDDGVRHLGRQAGVAETLAVTRLVKRYYVMATVRNGAAACSMIYSTIAQSVAPNYGGPLGPPGLRGTTCAAVMTKLFASRHAIMANDLARLKVIGVRIGGARGVALLSFGGWPETYMPLRLERGVWKIDALLDIEIP